MKFFSQFSGLTGGLWIYRCAIHGIALGFHIIPKSEGLNDPFSTIYCHWTESPKVIIADFNCLFQPYAIRREPEYFKDTVMMVDECHAAGAHKACSNAYNAMVYKDTGIPEYALLNDSSSEQRNRVINKLKKSGSYLRIENFTIQCKQILEMDNRMLIRKFAGWQCKY